MELKDLEKKYKRIQKQYYYQAKMAKIKADPEKYEEFKRKDRERQRAYYWAKKKQNTEPVKKPATVEELKAEIKRLKYKEVSKRYYAKLKADPERYAKVIERNRAYYLKKKAEKAVLKAAENSIKPVESVDEPHWNYPAIIGIANNEEDKNQVVGIAKEDDVCDTMNAACDNNGEEITDEAVNKAYDNLINTIRAYVPNFIYTSEIYRALDRYINAYSMFLESNKKVLLSEIIKLFNK